MINQGLKIIINAERLSSKRKEMKYSIKQLADLSDCTDERISQLEKGKHPEVKESLLLKLATALSCSPHYLCGLVNSPDDYLSEYYEDMNEYDMKQIEWTREKDYSIYDELAEALNELLYPADSEEPPTFISEKKRFNGYLLRQITNEYRERKYTNNIPDDSPQDKVPIILKKPFQSGNFDDMLIRKIMLLDTGKKLLLDAYITHMKINAYEECSKLNCLIDAYFSFPKSTTIQLKNTKDYAYDRLTSSIFPAIQYDAYNYIHLTKASALDACDLQDQDFKKSLDQALGDFQKESKAKLHLKIDDVLSTAKRFDYSTSDLKPEEIALITQVFLQNIQNTIKLKLNTAHYAGLFEKISDKDKFKKALKRALQYESEAHYKKILSIISSTIDKIQSEEKQK